jgi:hypothetical protein
MGKLRSRLTYANVISTLCLFMLLGGGAYAATKLPKNSVGTKQIKNGAITGKKIKKASIDSSKLTAATAAGLQGAKGERGERGERGETGPRGLQGAAGDPGAYATVDPAEPPDAPNFIGTHPGFISVERVPAEGATEEEREEEAGVYCLTPDASTSIDHPITSSNWADSSSNGVFVEPLARETAFSLCAEGQLEIHTYRFFAFEPGVPKPSNEVSFSVFAPGA